MDMTEEELQEHFNEENGGEDLTGKQAYNALCTCGKNPLPTEVVLFFENEGLDHDGTITFEQFKRLYDSMADPTVEDLAEAFKVFDRNEDGTIDRVELKEILLRREGVASDYTDDLDDETIEAIFNAVDSYGDENREGVSDGFLSYTELATYLIENRTLGGAPQEDQ